MSKELYSLLLQKQISEFKTVKQKKKYLVNCLKKSGSIKSDQSEISLLGEDSKSGICSLCGSSEFVVTTHEKICNECGKVTNVVPVQTREDKIRGSFIEPGTVLVTILQDGKRTTIDLSKVASWVDIPPEEQKFVRTSKEISEVLNEIRDPTRQPLKESISREVISMWYNILKFLPETRGRQKTSLQVLCVYYVLSFNNIPISIQKIASMFQIQLNEVYSNNNLIKKIFENTGYEKYITLTIGETCSLQVSDSIKRKIDIIKRDMIRYLHDPPTLKEYAGMVYYINKELKNREVTLKALSENCTISQNTISESSKLIESFYKKNKNLKDRLF
jgi:hypothetical protein